MKKYFGAACVLLLTAACSGPTKPRTPKENTAVADGNIATRTTVRNNGVLIDYTDSKKGDTVLLFVHGWAINKNYFSNQVSYFQDRYRVVTIDLPGYGQSGKNRNSWTIADFARDIDSVLTGLSLNKVILVGHSMSGEIVLDAALRDTQRVIAIVGIDNFKSVGVPEDEKEAREFQQAVKAMKKDFRNVVTGFFNQALFSKDTDTSVRKKVLFDVGLTDSTIAVATMESQQFDDTASLKKWHRTLYLVNSDYTSTDTTALHKMGIPFYLVPVSHSGHFPMVEQPQQFNKALQQIIDRIGIPANAAKTLN